MAEPMKFQELRVLQAAEIVADAIWRQVMGWNPLAREVVALEQTVHWTTDVNAPLFTDEELNWLTSIPNTYYPIPS